MRTKITAAVTIAVMVCVVLVSAVSYESAAIYAHKDFESQSTYEHLGVRTYLLNLVATQPTARALAQMRAFVDARYMSAVFGDGPSPACREDLDRLCLDDLPASLREDVRSNLPFAGYAKIRSVRDEAYVEVSQIARPHARTVTIVEVFSFHDYATDLGRLRRHLVQLTLGALVLALLVGYVVASGVRRPIRRVARTVERFGRGELDARTPVRGADELAALATGYNAMARRLSSTVRDLEESQSLQRRFVSDVSHELRTPLAAMLAAGEGLASDDPGGRERSAELLTAQTRRLAGLVDDLLEMSRFDAGQATLELEPVDLVELARDAVHTVAPDAEVRISEFGDTHAEVDVRRIHTVVRNLVANAVQHGAPPVEVILDGRDDQIVLTVSDEGTGVPPELLSTVFDRFVRADSARATAGQRNASSTGLGLAIARENALLHGADITLAMTGRTAFSCRLPRRPTSGTAEESPEQDIQS